MKIEVGLVPIKRNFTYGLKVNNPICNEYLMKIGRMRESNAILQTFLDA